MKRKTCPKEKQKKQQTPKPWHLKRKIHLRDGICTWEVGGRTGHTLRIRTPDCKTTYEMPIWAFHGMFYSDWEDYTRYCFNWQDFQITPGKIRVYIEEHCQKKPEEVA